MNKVWEEKDAVTAAAKISSSCSGWEAKNPERALVVRDQRYMLCKHCTRVVWQNKYKCLKWRRLFAKSFFKSTQALKFLIITVDELL